MLALTLCPALAGAQTGRVTGVVSDSATGADLEGARVRLFSGGAAVGIAESDGRGRFRLLGVAPGSYAVQVSRIGYAPSPPTPIEVGPGEQSVTVRLADKPYTLEPLVVTANLALETTLRSSSAVTVVPRETLKSTVAPTLGDHLRNVPGVDFASKGFFSNTFSARGPRGVTASDLLMLSDYRYAAVPVLEYNIAGLIRD